MINANWAEFWWTNITGAQALISEVANTLLDRRMVILQIPADLPWRQQMRSCIFDQYYKQSGYSSESQSVYIDAVDDNPDGLEPGKLVLDRVCVSAADRSGYRERSNITIQQYLVQKKLMENVIVWVKGLTGAAVDQWVRFLKGFPKDSALFVLECQGSSRIADSRAIHRICYTENISSYDLQLFNSFYLDSLTATYSPSWKRYIATAAALVCESDAEVSETLLRTMNFMEEEIPDGLARVADMYEFSRRGADADSKHVLSHIRRNKLDEITHRIWSAQVQVLFPIIEIERVSIINRLNDDLQTALKRNVVVQYNTRITDPMDVEFGTLCYMMAAREKDSDDRILSIPDEKLRERIHFLRECRNLLAHACCCTPKQIGGLLD